MPPMDVVAVLRTTVELYMLRPAFGCTYTAPPVAPAVFLAIVELCAARVAVLLTNAPAP